MISDERVEERGEQPYAAICATVSVFGGRVESYLTDPEEEPDPARWETEVAHRLADAVR